MRRVMRRIVAGAIPLAMMCVGIPAASSSTSPPLGNIRPGWKSPINFGVDRQIVRSSPALAMINGTAANPQPAIVVGDLSGRLDAVDLASGNLRTLYSSSVPIDAPPSAAPVTPGALDTVFFGRGNQDIACRAADGTWGGYTAVNADGTIRWSAKVRNPPGDTSCSHNGVMAGMSIVTLPGQLTVIGMSLGQSEHAFVAASGQPLAGWNPWFQADSSTSTVAVAQLNGSTKAPSIIEGGDSTQGNAYGYQYYNGGHVRIVKASGNGGTPGNGGLKCSFDTYARGGQIVASSPAVGGFLAGGATGIASGQGYFSASGGPVNRLWVLNSSCQKVWSAKTDYLTSSPILADVNGDGKLDVVVGTQDVSVGHNDANGSVFAFDGATGRKLWQTATGSVVGSLAAADLRGTGHADVVVPSANYGLGGLQILDGVTGDVMWRTQDLNSQGTPLITADPNGRIGITVAGYHGVLVAPKEVALAGTIRHYSIDGSSTANLTDPLTSWLEFHHDPRLSGNAAGPLP